MQSMLLSEAGFEMDVEVDFDASKAEEEDPVLNKVLAIFAWRVQ